MNRLARAVLRYVSFCANGCGTPVPSDQVMCSVCAWFSCTGGAR